MRRLAQFALLGLILASPAMGDPYGSATLKFKDVGRQAIRITDTRTGLGVDNLNVYAGVAQLQVWGYADDPLTLPVPGGADQFDGSIVGGFCIDVADEVGFGNVFGVDVTPLNESPDPDAAPVGGMGAVKASQIAWLLDNTPWVVGMNSVNGGALQVAIWEVVNEYGGVYDVYSTSADKGNFYSSSNVDVQDAAQDLLNNMLAVGGWRDYSFANYVGLSSDCKQDFVTRVVPLPGAALLGFLGLGAAGMRLRRLV